MKLMIISLSLIISGSAFGYSNSCSDVKRIDSTLERVFKLWISSRGREDIEEALVDGCRVILDEDNKVRCEVSAESIRFCKDFLKSNT